MGVLPYSVLMPLYKKDNPDWLKISLNSILSQTVKPSEIVIMKDGPLTKQLDNILDEYIKEYPNLFITYQFEQNVGLGVSLNKGIQLCSNEIIARMDADDYSLPDRCEKQLNKFQESPWLDLVGSTVLEFTGDISNVVSSVRLPEAHEDIIKFAKKRCPIRHPALMYKKSAVLRAGNYRNYRHAQDYNLIVHMILTGSKMYNIQESLTYMRVSPDFYRRRGGWNQFKLVLRLKKEFWNYGFYSFSDFFVSGIGNAVVCLMPNGLREFIYKKFLRK